jgi:hypothetical protein
MMASLRKIAFSVLGIVLMSAVVVVCVLGTQKVIERRRLSGSADQCRRLAEQGDANEEFKLARMYFDGKGVAKNYAEAIQWYRKAAEQGHVKAEFYLGEMYLRGQGTKEDYAEAVQWIQKAAKQNDSQAEAALGYIYYNGKGVTEDYTEAANWYRRASDQGYALAQQSLAYMYYNGQGVPQDYASALLWYRKAADQGDAAAEEGLGYMYATGRGVPQDRREAVAWYRLAAKHGNIKAKRALEPLEGRRLISTRNFELITVLIGFPVGIYLCSYFLLRRKKIQHLQQAAIIVLGAVFLCNAGLSLYAFLDEGVRYGPYRGAFDTARWVLNATAILAFLTTILRSNKKRNQTVAAAKRQ